MIYKKLGKTGIKIPAIGQGTAAFRRYPEEANIQIQCLRLGVELGMTFIDTAEQYGSGYSEEIAGQAIKGIRSKVFLATKVSPENLSYNGVLKAMDRSLKRLRTSYVDLYQIHWPNPNIPISETMSAMEKLIKDGKVRFIGVSNFSIIELEEAIVTCNIGIVSEQSEYNLFDHTIEHGIIPLCQLAGITVIGYSPLDHNRLSGGEEELKALQAIADKYNKTVAQVTLNWLITNPAITVIPKASNSKHVRENAVAGDFTLTKEDIKEIGRLFKHEFVYVWPSKIRLGVGDRKDYRTIEEAMENRLKVALSPIELAEGVKKGIAQKAIRITPIIDNSEQYDYDYDLVEGGMRYWAHVIAHDEGTPIKALIRGMFDEKECFKEFYC